MLMALMLEVNYFSMIRKSKEMLISRVQRNMKFECNG